MPHRETGKRLRRRLSGRHASETGNAPPPPLPPPVEATPATCPAPPTVRFLFIIQRNAARRKKVFNNRQKITFQHTPKSEPDVNKSTKYMICRNIANGTKIEEFRNQIISTNILQTNVLHSTQTLLRLKTDT